MNWCKETDVGTTTVDLVVARMMEFWGPQMIVVATLRMTRQSFVYF